MSVFVTVALAVAARAQIDAQFDELKRLSDEHNRTVSSATRMLDDVYRLTLRRIERELAERGDYNGAMRARDRAEAILAEPAPAVARTAGMMLTAGRARTQGVVFDRGKDVLEFRKTGAVVFWELLGIMQGQYEVVAVFSVGPPENRSRSGVAEVSPCGGTFAWKIETRLGESATELPARVGSTGSWDNFIRLTLGRCEFKSRSATVRIDAVAALPGGLMNLHRVELKPVAADNGFGAAAASLRELKERNHKRLLAATAPVREKYQAELEKLERELVQQGDKAGAEAVAAERVKLSPAAEAKTTTP